VGGSGGLPGVAGGAGAPAAPNGCDNPSWDPADFATVYEVGPGLPFETPSQVPWEALEPGTLVRIRGRAEPYRDKWVVSTAGTADRPIVVLGVPTNGVLPVITGAGATTRRELDYWNEPRGIVKVGGSNAPAGPAAHVSIECLDIQNGRAGATFTAADGSSHAYADNAACVYLEEGSFITVKNNLIHGCGNGIFASSGSSDVLIAGNYVFDNGNPGSIYEHNSYTEALGITFEFNQFGPLCADCGGNNLKDRSAGTVVRYNWLEGGNRQLDLVESDHEELVAEPRYRSTFVYGNVLVEPDAAGNSQIVHYGGDGGDEATYRKGTLYFFHNTVVSTRSGNTTLFRLSSEGESALAFNNVVSVAAGGGTLALSAGAGVLDLADNCLPEGWVPSHDVLTGVIAAGTNVLAASPGFVNASAQDFALAAGSACVDRGAALPAGVAQHAVLFEYVRHHAGRARPAHRTPDLGAYECE
jgi:parallel beta-helix repeat protein